MKNEIAPVINGLVSDKKTYFFSPFATLCAFLCGSLRLNLNPGS